MVNILIFFILTLILLGMGKLFINRLVSKVRFTFLEETIISFGLGAGVLALLVLAVGLAGFLYRWVFIAVLLILLTIFWKNSITTIKDAIVWLSRIIKISFLPWEQFLILAIAFVSFFTLIGSLSPLLGMDAAAYHMYDPKFFIQAHAIVPIPFSRESLWPFLIQMLFTLGLCLKGVVLAKLFHFSFYLASLLAIYVLCRRYWLRSHAILAAAIFALTPAIFTGTTYAYTDLAVVFYTVLAFYGFFAWLDTNNNRWFYFSGIVCGFLLGIKITSGIVPVLILVLYSVHVFSRNIKFLEKLFPGLIFLLFLTAVCGVWYVRSWIVLGNPIYPFAARFFCGNGYPEWTPISGIGNGWKSFLILLWPLTFYPQWFGGESIGVIFLIFLPFLIFARQFSRFVCHIIIIALCLYTSWFFVFQYTRFLYPTLVFLSIVVTFVYSEIFMKDSVTRKFTTAILVVVFFYSASLAVYHNFDKFPVVFGIESERNFLTKHERSYAVADYVNSHLPPNAKLLLIAEPRLYYFDRESAMVDLINIHLVMKGDSQKLENYLKTIHFDDYMLFLRDDSKNRCEDPSLFTPSTLFTEGDIQLLKQIAFSYRDERYVYELWKISSKRRKLS